MMMMMMIMIMMMVMMMMNMTLPYRDYTIDAETIAKTYAGNYSAWFLKSEV
jgi:hypothetical protein